MAGAAGKGEGRIITIGDNRYGMPEEYDPARRQATLDYYKRGDTWAKKLKAVYDGRKSDKRKRT